MKATPKRTVRIVFGATVLWITLGQYVFFAIGGGETYPAVALPGFPAECRGCPLETGVPTRQEPTLVVQFSNGRRQQISAQDIAPPGPFVRLLIIPAAFKDTNFTKNANFVHWLQTRIIKRFPGETPTGLDVTWGTATYRGTGPSDREFAPIQTTHVDFERTNEDHE